MRGSNKLPGNQAGINDVYGQYKSRAKRLGLVFHLTKEEFVEETSRDCFYCGLPPSTIGKPRYKTFSGEVYLYNGLDRVNNEHGYTVGNCVACCEQCNRAKLDYSQAEFIGWVKRVHDCMDSNHMMTVPTEIYLAPLPSKAS